MSPPTHKPTSRAERAIPPGIPSLLGQPAKLEEETFCRTSVRTPAFHAEQHDADDFARVPLLDESGNRR